MQNRTTEDLQSSRVFVDINRVADRTFGEVFTTKNVAADEVGQILWDFLLANEILIEIDTSLDPGTDIRSLVPKRVTEKKLNKLDRKGQVLERGKTYVFSDLYKRAWIDFESVAGDRLGSVLGAGRQSQDLLFGKLWKFVEARNLRRLHR
jgi:hypothetical protein